MRAIPTSGALAYHRTGCAIHASSTDVARGSKAMNDQILQGDALQVLQSLQSDFIQTVITSPPYYGLRDYGMPGQIGLEETPEAYIARLVEVFREVRRVLRPDGTLWLNCGDSYGVGKQ